MENTIKDFLINMALRNKENTEIRLEKLKAINAPEIMIKQIEEALNCTEKQWIDDYIKSVKKLDISLSNEKIESYENRVGNGGKKFIHIKLKNGKSYNYFPNSKYGRVIFLHTKDFKK